MCVDVPDLRLHGPLYALLWLVASILCLLTSYQRPPKLPEIEDTVFENWASRFHAAHAHSVDKDEDDDIITVPGEIPEVKEPVWLTDKDLFSLGIPTTASSAPTARD